eukprot:gene7392-9988_t
MYSSFEWESGRDGRPIHASHTPPKSWYVDVDEVVGSGGSSTFFRAVEQPFVFSGSTSWLLAGRVEQIPQPGDFLATQVLGEPIILTRTENGEYKAFYNVCRHHAAKICDEGPGSLACARDDNGQVRVAGRFTCPYHGWQYSIDGRLSRAVGMQGCENFRCVNLPLVVAVKLTAAAAAPMCFCYPTDHH